ncbi:MAG: IPT/TIG domain-containing protein [Cyanobacteria bacterium P01_D01_bin.50]
MINESGNNNDVEKNLECKLSDFVDEISDVVDASNAEINAINAEIDAIAADIDKATNTLIGLSKTVNDDSSNNNVSENIEWELSDLADAIAAEIDEAQNTLSLKSHVRGLSFAIKKLSLDIEIKARRTADGKFRFRTVNSNETSASIIKLDFAQVLQSQLNDVRKPLDDNNLSIASVSALEFLPEITPDDIKALNKVGITSIDDLESYPKTSQVLAELSRKTGIEEYRIRRWRQLPFIAKVTQSESELGNFTIDGGNFGNLSSSNLQVFFQQKQLKIIEKHETYLTVEMPSDVSGTGFFIVRVGEQITNPLNWN